MFWNKDSTNRRENLTPGSPRSSQCFGPKDESCAVHFLLVTLGLDLSKDSFLQTLFFILSSWKCWKNQLKPYHHSKLICFTIKAFVRKSREGPRKCPTESAWEVL